MSAYLAGRLLENKNHSYVLLLLFSVLILVGVSLFGLMDIKLAPVQMLMLHMIVNVEIILMIQANNIFNINQVRKR